MLWMIPIGKPGLFKFFCNNLVHHGHCLSLQSFNHHLASEITTQGAQICNYVIYTFSSTNNTPQRKNKVGTSSFPGLLLYYCRGWGRLVEILVPKIVLDCHVKKDRTQGSKPFHHRNDTAHTQAKSKRGVLHERTQE